MRITYRPAVERDLAAEHRIFCRAEGGLLQAHGYAWSDPPAEAFTDGLRHLLRHDGDRCWVAEGDGAVVGYTAAFVRGSTWFFSMLFIDPEVQGQGIGRALFDLAVRDAPSRRLTITDSIQPISNAVYGRQGLLPVATILPMSGEGGLPRSTDLELGPFDTGALEEIDLAAYGFDRGVDHAFWESNSARHCWYRAGRLVGYAYRSATGGTAPLAAIDAPTAAAVLSAELSMAGPISVEIPATARSLLRTALEAGLRIDPPPGLLLASDGVAPPTALAIRSYGFY